MYSALIKALTGREPKVYRMKDGKIEIVCVREHLNNFMRYAELVDVIRELAGGDGASVKSDRD